MKALDAALKVKFPEDFHRHCIYGAMGLSELLTSQGISNKIVAGRYKTITVDVDTQNTKTAGFFENQSSPSHFWVVIDSKIIDLSPHYLTKPSNAKLAVLPALFMFERSELSYIIKYQVKGVGSRVQFSDYNHKTSTENFIDLCRCFFNKPVSRLPPSYWLLSSTSQIDQKSKLKDVWSM